LKLGMKGVWNPTRYLRFESERLRPALDLFQQAIKMYSRNTTSTVADIGCGPGQMAPFFRANWPSSHIFFVDLSDSMLAKAKMTHEKDNIQNVSYIKSSIEEYQPPESSIDFIFSNAAFHWVPNHVEVVIPRYIKMLTKGGVFAMQIPDTRAQPTHTLMRKAGESLGLQNILSNIRIPSCQNDPNDYYKALAPLCEDINMWSTEYVMILRGETPVTDFVIETGMKPFLDALGGEKNDLTQQFLREYNRLTKQVYRPIQGFSSVNNEKDEDGADQVTLVPYKRFFLVCQR